MFTEQQAGREAGAEQGSGGVGGWGGGGEARAGPGGAWDSPLASERPQRGFCQHMVPEAGVKPGTVPGRAIHPIRAPGWGREAQGGESRLFQKKKAGSIFPSEGLDPWRACRSAGGLTRPGHAAPASLLLRQWPG